MATAAKKRDAYRWVKRIRDAASFADDLGDTGCWAGPRTGPLKRTHGQKEDYVLRRVLVAWRKAGALTFPVNIHAERESPGEPDFLLVWDDGRTLGVEITEAGEENYQKWLTETEPYREAGRNEGLDRDISGASDRARKDYAAAIERKIKKRKTGASATPEACDLAIYDNTETGGFIDPGGLLREIAESNRFAGYFRQIHLVKDMGVVLDALAGDRKQVDLIDTYETDYAGWIFDQVDRLRERAERGEIEIDAANIAEELSDLGVSERRAVKSHLVNLLVHLLKWEFQPHQRTNSWRYSTDEARDQVSERLTVSPSLRPWFWDQLEDVYARARTRSAREAEVPRDGFPPAFPYTAEKLVDPEFFPREDA